MYSAVLLPLGLDPFFLFFSFVEYHFFHFLFYSSLNFFFCCCDRVVESDVIRALCFLIYCCRFRESQCLRYNILVSANSCTLPLTIPWKLSTMGVVFQSFSAAVAAFFLFGWTDPSWTQRKFFKSNSTSRLALRSRDENVNQLRSFCSEDAPMDLLVIGGGAVGTGVALDATLRGLQVGMVEMQDYGSGTSSRSTKLIHGGIRYLEKAVMKMDLSQLKLVSEALHERGIMIHQAPHLCHPLPTLVPCYDVFELIKIYVGVKLYDVIGALTRGTVKYSSYVSPYEALRIFPFLRTTSPTNSALQGAVVYYDGQMNDARLCLTVGMTASALGAAVTNYTQVVSSKVVVTNDKKSVVKTTILDRESGDQFSVFSRAVINAGGVFASKINDLHQGVAEGKPSARFHLLPSLGTHIVVNRSYCPREHHAMVVPSSDGRVVFAIPWLGSCLIGTTDVPCQITTDPRPSEEEVQFLLDSVKPFVGVVPKKDIRSSWAGIRPLVAPSLPPEDTKRDNGDAAKTTDTQNVVREHFISVDNDRKMVSVSGGKWTTYRKIAEETVNAAIKHFPSDLKKEMILPCSTENIVLLGAQEFEKVPESPTPRKITEVESSSELSTLPNDIHHHLKYTYGDRYFDLRKMFEMGNNHSSKESQQFLSKHLGKGTENMLCKRLIESGKTTEKDGVKLAASDDALCPDSPSPVTAGEVIWASRYEHAEHIMDFLARRTRMAFLNAHEAKEAIPMVADLMAAEKKWSQDKKKKEIDLAYVSLQSFLVGISSLKKE